VRLLDRNPMGVAPTAYGRTLLGGGATVFGELRQAVKGIEFLADPAAGHVRIGCSPLLAPSFVSAVIDRVSRRDRVLSFNLTSAPVETVHLELDRRNVDLFDHAESRPHRG
jgi:DNA-binding transcriptional LysR family regulator